MDTDKHGFFMRDGSAVGLGLLQACCSFSAMQPAASRAALARRGLFNPSPPPLILETAVKHGVPGEMLWKPL
jgi:hypothetical protein